MANWIKHLNDLSFFLSESWFSIIIYLLYVQYAASPSQAHVHTMYCKDLALLASTHEDISGTKSVWDWDTYKERSNSSMCCLVSGMFKC